MLPHARSFVGPSYYAKFRHGPSSSMRYFPICAYEEDLTNSVVASRTAGMGVNCLDEEFSGGCHAILNAIARHGMTEDVNPANPSSDPCPGTSGCGSFSNPLGCFSGGDSNVGRIFGYALYDEPNVGAGPYSMTTCPSSPPIITNPAQDTCAQQAITDTDTLRRADPNRAIWGTFTKDLLPWQKWPPSGWSGANCGRGTAAASNGIGTVSWNGCFEKHQSMLMSGMSILAADIYGWTDPYEASNSNMDRGCNNSAGHCGAWVDAYAVDRIRHFRSGIPAWAFLGMTRSRDSSDVETPRMLSADVWDSLAHGARGIIWWTADLASGAPVSPYAGANCSMSYDAICDHHWDANYNQAQADDAQIRADAVDLNSPTVIGVSATASDGTPIAVLAKDVNSTGKLWLLVTADGNATHPMSNRSPMTATITVPRVIPAGTVLNVAGENRTVTVNGRHQFKDTFGTATDGPGNLPCGCTVTYGYQHHIYAMLPGLPVRGKRSAT